MAARRQSSTGGGGAGDVGGFVNQQLGTSVQWNNLVAQKVSIARTAPVQLGSSILFP